MAKADQEIRKLVLRELEWDIRTNDAAIDVEVSSGAVTLIGSFSSWAQKIAAQNAAHRVQGVLDVANDLQIVLQGKNGRGDTEIAQKRVARTEAAPGVTSFDQISRLVALMGYRLVLEALPSGDAPTAAKDTTSW